MTCVTKQATRTGRKRRDNSRRAFRSALPFTLWQGLTIAAAIALASVAPWQTHAQDSRDESPTTGAHRDPATVLAAVTTQAKPATPSSATADEPANRRASLLSNIKTWGYQLQKLNMASAAASTYDLLVIDPSALDYGPKNWGRKMLQRLKLKPDGARRHVVAYLSIGEAESYRSYWRKHWVSERSDNAAAATATTTTSGTKHPTDNQLHKLQERITPPRPRRAKRPHRRLALRHTGIAQFSVTPNPSRLAHFASPDLNGFTAKIKSPLQFPTDKAPAWLGYENANWRGNFHVRYWHEGWQNLIRGSPQAAIDKLIAAGFDGVYLDRADAYEAWQFERRSAAKDMRHFIAQLARYARKQKPDFVVILQNAEELLEDPDLRQAIDAFAKEDLLYSQDDTGDDPVENAKQDIKRTLKYLKLAQQDRRPVLVIEYLQDHASQAAAGERLKLLGFIPYFGPRELDPPEILRHFAR